jgi:HEPN domain-containing protein
VVWSRSGICGWPPDGGRYPWRSNYVLVAIVDVRRFLVSMAEPRTPAQWRAAGHERSRDASALAREDRKVGAYYFYGFTAECFAKALLAAQPGHGGSVPKVHDIVDLLDRAGIRRQRIPAPLRKSAEIRDVSIRYQAQWPEGLEEAELDRIKTLGAWLEVRVRRARG